MIYYFSSFLKNGRNLDFRVQGVSKRKDLLKTEGVKFYINPIPSLMRM